MPELDPQGRELLDAARRLLADEGLAALTVRRIAGAAGCSTMGVYSRFGGKDGVLDRLVAEGFERLASAMDGVPVTDDPLADLHECGLTYRRNALENPCYYLVMFGARPPDYLMNPETVEVATSTFTRLVERIRRCQDAGLFVADPPEEMADVIWGSIHGHVMLELVGKSVTGIDPAVRYEHTLTLIERGFRAPGAEAPRGGSGAGGI